MNSNQNPLPSEAQQPARKTWLLISILVAILFAIVELVTLWMSGNHQVWAILPVVVAVPIAYWLNRTNRQVQGSTVLLAGIAIKFILVLFVQHGLGMTNTIMSLAVAVTVCLTALPHKYFRWALLGALVTFIASIIVDLFANNAASIAFGLGHLIIFLVMLMGLAAFLVKEFPSLDIRAKIVMGILGTGASALAVFIIFAFAQTQQVTNTLSARLEASVKELAEEQLKNMALKQADQANGAFEDAIIQVNSLAQNWSALYGQKEVISQRTYWDASTNLVQLPGGQYSNSYTPISSVFVPKGVPIDDALVIDLNTSAYLDFYAPAAIKVNPLLIAIYAVDTRGIIRRYPNNNLASTLEPDFDVTKEPYYSLTAPLLNPKRLARWVIPNIDAKSGKLYVTVAMPAYQGDLFIGVVAANMQLDGIAEQVNSVKIGETGYAYMIDDAGHIISMPPAGFEMFGIHPEDVNTKEFYQRSIEDSGTLALKSLTKRMMAGGNGLSTVDVNGVETYISYSPIKTNGYSVALVVPVSELQGTIIAANRETQQQVRSTTRTALLILILLLISAIVVSLGLGRLIAAPIQRLTQVASQIAGGDLSVQATTTTRDEIGVLAQSFNTMTARLRQTLDGLEHMVQERTSELFSANERNERRAQQFESIAKVARTISSTRDLDTLLAQITTVISREFGFYHVGIFLLDTAKEYAILSATNSAGGRVMLQRGHRLKVGETGIVGYVTATGNPRVALDTGADAVFFNSPDLPETRSEIALPLRTGDEIMGALDVQSIEPGVFAQEDINILSTLADQVSVAIQNARQFEQTRKALSESEALSKQFAKTGWQQYTKDKNLVGIRHTGAKATLLYDRNGDKEEEARDVISAQIKPRGAFLSLPIELRGQVIGSVDVRSPDSRPWDQDELDIITAIIERSAVAMENARLLEESQRLASKEAKIGTVTAKISSSINMRSVLQTAVEELGRALPGSEVVIQFQTDQNKTTS